MTITSARTPNSTRSESWTNSKPRASSGTRARVRRVRAVSATPKRPSCSSSKRAALRQRCPRRSTVAFVSRSRHRRRAAWIGAVAAAFVLGLLPWGWTMTQQHQNGAAQPAVDAMLVGHFSHAPLLPLQAGAPPAKVIYAREGGWIYVLAGAGTSSLDVATVTAGRTAVVAALAPSGATRAAFVKIAGPSRRRRVAGER